MNDMRWMLEVDIIINTRKHTGCGTSLVTNSMYEWDFTRVHRDGQNDLLFGKKTHSEK